MKLHNSKKTYFVFTRWEELAKNTEGNTDLTKAWLPLLWNVSVSYNATHCNKDGKNPETKPRLLERELFT